MAPRLVLLGAGASQPALVESEPAAESESAEGKLPVRAATPRSGEGARG